jgi:YVTN family beta-propeller protein
MSRHTVGHAIAFAAALLVFAQGQAQAQSFVNFETPQVHPLDISSSGQVLVAVNTADNRLEVFDIVAGTPTWRGSVYTGLEPVSVRMRGTGEAWVVNQLSDSLSVVDLATMRVTRTIRVGDEPADIIFAGTPTRAYVSLAQPRQIVVFDPTLTAPTLTTITIAGCQPRALAVSPTGAQVYAAIFESGNRSVQVPRATVSAQSSPYGGQNPPPNSGQSFSPAINPSNPTAPRVAHIARKNAQGQWVDGNNRNWTSSITWDVVDNDVAIIQTSTNAVSYARGLMTTVAGLATAPDGRVLVVGTEANNEIRFESKLNGIFARCNAALLPAGGSGAATIFDLNPHLNYTLPSTDIMTRLQSVGDPRTALWHPDGTRAFIAGMGSNSVVAVSPTGTRLAMVAVGEGPTGLALAPDGSRLYVLNRFAANISTIDTASNTELGRASFYDPTPAAVRAGRPLLYDTHLTSGLGHLSCASCHVDARSDRIAWDLGDPAGEMIGFNATCVEAGACIDWHPMKGPMVTQTLQGIIGQEPLHWRGEKAGIEEFNVAYTHLQGRESEISTEQMAQLKAYIATLAFGPQPNKNIDNTLRTSLPIFGGIVTGYGGTGNPQAGQNLFNNLVVLPGAPGANTRCVDCHPGSVGTGNEIGIPLGPVPQNRKIPHLREVYRKVGADLQSTSALRGFGFNADSEFATMQDLLQIGFNWGTGATAVTRRRDMEAFMLSFGSDTHAGVGQQAMASNGGGAGDDVTRINQLVSIATTGAAGLVVKGIRDGVERGWVLEGGSFRSDRQSEALLSPAALLQLSGPQSPMVYTLVVSSTARRIGIDRDGDSFFDSDERDAGSDPADPTSVPGSCTGDLDGSHVVDGADLGALLANWNGSGFGDIDQSGVVDGVDLGMLLAAWGNCP